MLLITSRSVLAVIILIPGILLASMNPGEPEEYGSPILPIESPVDNLNNPDFSDRGKLLYNNHCLGCHNPNIHSRQSEKVRSIKDIRQWVIRWSHNLGLDWKSDDIDIVTEYLNHHYYHFPHSE